MFALCIYDKKNKKVYIARDLFGQKPLYYYQEKNLFIISSEIKGISSYIDKVEPDFFGSLNPILQTGIAASNHTMFKNIKRLLPGEILSFDMKSEKTSKKKFLKIGDLVNKNEYKRLKEINNTELIKEYFTTLSNTVNDHAISDAQIAVAASLGLDSTIILDLLEKKYDKKINCISYISHEDEKIFNRPETKKY